MAGASSGNRARKDSVMRRQRTLKRLSNVQYNVNGRSAAGGAIRRFYA